MKRLVLFLLVLSLSSMPVQANGLDSLAGALKSIGSTESLNMKSSGSQKSLKNIGSIDGVYVGDSTEKGLLYKRGFKYVFSSGKPAVGIWIKDGDMLEQKVDAIVDAANVKLLSGGGVTGILQEKAKAYADDQGVSYGDFIVDVWRKNKLGGLDGEAQAWLNTNTNVRVTNKSKDHAMQIMHVAGPQCSGSMTQNKKKTLHDSYYSALTEAEKNGIKTIAFPFISGGIFGCGTADGGQAAISGVMDYFVDHPDSKIQRVDIVLWNDAKRQYYFVNGLRGWAQRAGKSLDETDELKKEALRIKSN